MHYEELEVKFKVDLTHYLINSPSSTALSRKNQKLDFVPVEILNNY